MEKLALPRLELVAEGTVPEAAQTRPVYFSGLGWVETPVVARHSLRAGHGISGPAIIEQLDATTVIYPGHRAAVDAYGNLLIHIPQAR